MASSWQMELQSQELGELDQGSSVNSITNETPFAAEMKSEPPLDVPVVFHTDLLPLPFPFWQALSQPRALHCFAKRVWRVVNEMFWCTGSGFLSAVC